jgi:hypothetical protein
MKKQFISFILFYALTACACFASEAPPGVVSGSIATNGITTPTVFEEGKAVIIIQANEPVAVRFEQVDGYWSFTLYEFKIVRYEDIRNTESADGIEFDDNAITLLYHIQTYPACDVRQYVLVPYNFTLNLNVHCPEVDITTND